MPMPSVMAAAAGLAKREREMWRRAVEVEELARGVG
jgi:hypothetical protein